MNLDELITSIFTQTCISREALSRYEGILQQPLHVNTVTEMRRCLKHGRQRLLCNRPHAPLSLSEKVLNNVTLTEFASYMQLLYHLRRFVKGLSISSLGKKYSQADIVKAAQEKIMVRVVEPSEPALWLFDCAHGESHGDFEVSSIESSGSESFETQGKRVSNARKRIRV